MPPSPKITVKLDEERFFELCTELAVSVPTVKFVKGTRDGRPAWGDYQRETGVIRIYLGVDQYENERLPFAQTECVRTLLHELRHHYQSIHTPKLWDNIIALEMDAEGYAQENIAKFKTLIRLRREFPNSGFSRLSRHIR